MVLTPLKSRDKAKCKKPKTYLVTQCQRNVLKDRDVQVSRVTERTQGCPCIICLQKEHRAVHVFEVRRNP